MYTRAVSATPETERCSTLERHAMAKASENRPACELLCTYCSFPRFRCAIGLFQRSTLIQVSPDRADRSIHGTSLSPPQLTCKTYISVVGQNFASHKTLVHPYGSTMYPHWYYHGALHRGGGWTYTAFRSYIDQIVSMAQQAHLNTLRPTNFFDGIAYGDWYNATVWSNMDYLFQEAASHGMYVILDLSSFRDKTLKQGIYPYDPSLYTAAFSWVATRYADNPALLNYAIAGEVACPTSSDPLRPDQHTGLNQLLSGTLRHTACSGPQPSYLVRRSFSSQSGRLWYRLEVNFLTSSYQYGCDPRVLA